MKVMAGADAPLPTITQKSKIATFNINNVNKRLEGSSMRQLKQLAGRLDERARAE